LLAKKCFVLMPFSGPFDQYYKNVLVPGIKDAGYEPVRADEIYGTRPIIEDIFNGIREASALVADVTNKNPNVNYELGIAHALERPVVIISQRIEDIPFDYRHIRAIIYDTKQTDWYRKLKADITKTLKEIKRGKTKVVSSTSPLGIKKVYKDRGDLRLSEYLYESEPGSEINILGVALNDLTNAIMRAPIKQKLEQNCRFRILWLNPNSKFGKQRASEENWDYRKWQTNLKSQTDALNTLPTLVEPFLRKNMALSQYDAPPTYFIFMTTKVLIVGFYLRGKFGAASHHLEIDIGSSLATEFLNHFKSVWESTGKRWNVFR
jgi:hypothetical protein